MKFQKEADWHPSMNRTVSVNVTLMFLVLIFGISAATVIKPQNERSETENRSLAMRPSFSIDTLLSGQFAKDYESYLSDQFIGRDGWITLKTDFELAAGKKNISGVYFAKDGYLIESHEGSFTTDQAKANISLLASFAKKEAEALGADHMTVMIVPNAVDILREKLPAFAQPYDEEAYISQVRAALPDGVFFDTGKILNEHKDEEIYYRTDHHWKTLAAWYVYQAWAKEKGFSVGVYSPVTVTEDFEGTISSKLGIRGRADSIQRYDPVEAEDYYLVYNQSDDVRNSIYDDSFLDKKDKYSYFYGGNYGLIQSKMPESRTGRKLLIIKDSYAHCFAPFTYADFDEVDLLDLRYYNASLSDLIASGGYTDILFLQNASGFAEETSFAKLGT